MIRVDRDNPPGAPRKQSYNLRPRPRFQPPAGDVSIRMLCFDDD
jgi:hypothetical protein